MKKLNLYLLAFVAVFSFSCSSDDDVLPVNGGDDGEPVEDVVDTTAPQFAEILRPGTEDASGVVRLRGDYMEVRSESSTHGHFRGTVTDDVALSEMRLDIHGVFDGHTHGREGLLPEFRVDSIIELNGATVHEFDIDFYYDAQNFRAGPYDVAGHAVDEAGNQTSFADGSSVLRHIYLRRPYQPLVVLEGDPNEEAAELALHPGDELAADLYIEQNRGDGELAFPITFIRISIVEDHDDHGHDHRVSDEERYEGMWGTSYYLTSTTGAGLTGDPLPEATEDRIWMSQLVTGDNAYQVSEGDNHMILRLEIEDEGGNIAIREFELEVHD